MPPKFADPVDFPRDKREFDGFPLHRALGLTLEELRPGFARVAIAASPVTMGGVGGSVHGGVLAAVVDIVMLEALAKMFEPGEQPAGTADLNITYMRPALGNTVFAEAIVLKKGRSLIVTEVSILDDEGRLCAKGRTLYSVRQPAAKA
ncbi:MAG: PaaI family thioesterase [Dehalococcoidia bacterium]|nr:PaaI family thioesterase [Dehalococcoidia bacterium]